VPCSLTNVQRLPSRSATWRLTSAGTWRESPFARASSGVGVAELALLEPLHQVRERQLQDVGDIASGPGVRQQFLRAAKQVVRVLAQRELHGVATWRGGSDARSGRCAQGRPTTCDTRVVVTGNLPRGKFA
jgi:hypothetical protein